MLLYDKKENSIDVYEFMAEENDLYDYRKQEMKKIPEDKIIYRAEAFKNEKTKKYKYYDPLFIRHKDAFNSKIIPMSHANSAYYGHWLIQANPEHEHKIYLLENFLSGNFNKCKIARIKDDEKIRYFLLTWQGYLLLNCNPREEIMKDIIEVPETLYYIQLLEQEKFSFLENCYIAEQLALYSMKYVDEIDLNMLKKNDDIGMAKGSFQKAINKANSDSIILHKYRKIK